MEIKSTGVYTDTSALQNTTAKQTQHSNNPFTDHLINAVASTASTQPTGKTASTDTATQASQPSPDRLPDRVEQMIKQLEENPDQKEAMQAVQMHVKSMMTPFVRLDLTLPPDDPNFERYVATGELRSPAQRDREDMITQQVLKESARIFGEGIEQGLSAAEIFRNVEQYKADNLPEDFLRNTGWYGTA